jgi:hypothetical protein
LAKLVIEGYWSLKAMILVTIENLVTGRPEMANSRHTRLICSPSSKRATKHRRSFMTELSSMASAPPACKSPQEVLRMCLIRSVTYVSGRSTADSANSRKVVEK